MRVVVQNDPRHPDNYGYVVTHVGLNVDKQLADFRDMEREDKAFFEDLISGAEPELPPEVLSGTARMKLGSDMVVHQEVVSDFFEEDFLRSDDEAIYDELRAHAESLGLDAEAVVEAARKKEVEKVRRVKASAPFPVVPQAERREARKRLREEANRTAKLLLNRLGLDYGSRELAFKYAPGVTGSNFVAAVQNGEPRGGQGARHRTRQAGDAEDRGFRSRDGGPRERARHPDPANQEEMGDG
jgi:DNA repair protein RadD